MKQKLFLPTRLFLAIIFIFSSFTLLAQVKNRSLTTTHTSPTYTKTSSTRVSGHVYTERVLSPDYSANYKVFCDVRSFIADTMVRLAVERAKTTEEFFGLIPTTFLKEIHFINDKKRSFFTSEKPSFVFITTVTQKKPEYYENDGDYSKFVYLKKTEHMRHEICHLIDYWIKFSDDSKMAEFMNRINNLKMTESLFKLVYLTLVPSALFDDEITDKYMANHPEVASMSGTHSTSVAFEVDELFAEAITNLDSEHWVKALKKTKENQELFVLYKEMLNVFKEVIVRSLYNSKMQTKNVPVVLLIEKRINQMNGM